MNAKGVYETSKKDGTSSYRVSITVKGKHISLGSFADKNDAALCYEESQILLKTTEKGLRLPSPYCHIPFEKYISLCNLRDNHLYISNPIYIYSGYFHYYLSEQEVLTFDTDNLFYYISHKIMRRGNRLFVADYGMQLSILSRYGIKPYAVAGKDYFFINGDSYDLRYENIRVVNPYHGITHLPTQIGKPPRYRVRIHIRSYYVVGVYSDLITAAIAYNKAIDIVKKQGVKKEFLSNDLSDLPAKTYAEIYVQTQIKDEIYHLADKVNQQ